MKPSRKMAHPLRSISSIFERTPVRFRILQLTYVEKMTQEEVAREVGLCQKSVSNHIEAALETLRQSRNFIIDFDPMRF